MIQVMENFRREILRLKFYFCSIILGMKKALLYFGLGTVISFLINYLFIDSSNVRLEVYYAIAFGLAWGMAYFLDNPKFSLFQKMSSSFGMMALLVAVGAVIFNLELAIPSILKFSTVFVAYYLIASFRASKSLRNQLTGFFIQFSGFIIIFKLHKSQYFDSLPFDNFLNVTIFNTLI